MSKQAYFNGEFYQCATATNAGESPTTHPAKWRRIQIPKEFRPVLAKLTYANLLDIDGQKDKSLAEMNRARLLLEDLVRKEAQKEQWRHRPNVQVRCG